MPSQSSDSTRSDATAKSARGQPGPNAIDWKSLLIGAVAGALITPLVIALTNLTARFVLHTQKWHIIPQRDIPRWYRWAAYPPVWVWFSASVLLCGFILLWQLRKPKSGAFSGSASHVAGC